MDPGGVPARRQRNSQKARSIAVVAFCVAALVGIGAWDTTMSRAGPESGVAQVSVFTLVSTGIVYVAPDTADIIWKNTHQDQKKIGEEPWRNPTGPRSNALTGLPAWRDHRDIVGNPKYDLVAWVETVAGLRGGLVVVEASTGHILARASLSAPRHHSVVLASVDQETVYFATPDPRAGSPNVQGADIWIWRWAAGDDPENLQRGRYYNDVSSGIWAVYGRSGYANGVEFEDSNRRTRATMAFSPDKPADFGGALSPDGRYWYGATTSQIVETATGNAVRLPTARERNYGWTGIAELTLSNPFLVCSAATGQCRGPAADTPTDVCAVFAVVCGSHLPVN